MPRKTLLSTFALACALGASSLGAQQAAPPGAPAAPTAADTANTVRALPAMRIVAEKQEATREQVLALMQENRRLVEELRRHDRKVEELSRRLAHLRGPVTDKMEKDIARFNAEAAETRARRQALEAQLVAQGSADQR